MMPTEIEKEQWIKHWTLRAMKRLNFLKIHILTTKERNTILQNRAGCISEELNKREVKDLPI